MKRIIIILLTIFLLTGCYDNIELDSAKIGEFTHLLYDNLWYNYFDKTLDTASGWIDFEKEISIVIKSLDKIILCDKNCVLLPQNSPLDAFVLSNFRFFVDARTTVNFYEGETWNIKKQYLKEYPCNSGIYIANRKTIF